MQNPVHWLESEYLRRREKNPRYSLRAFAKLLDLPSGRVSQLLSRKRHLTPMLAARIAVRLGADPALSQELFAQVASDRAARRKLPSAPVAYKPLDMDQFEAIANPVHFAILALLETKGFPGTLREIARRLGLNAVEARAAADRLVRLGLARYQGPRLKLAHHQGLTTSHDVQNTALRHAHRKVLEESIEALEAVPVEERDVTSITVAIDPRRLPEAKRRIREFRRALAAYLEGGEKTEVYRLNVQMIPVSQRKKT